MNGMQQYHTTTVTNTAGNRLWNISSIKLKGLNISVNTGQEKNKEKSEK